MKFLTNIEEKRFDDFAIASPWNHYTKTSYWGKMKQQEGAKALLCGVEDEDGALLATALLLIQSSGLPKRKFGYVSYGWNCDIQNVPLMKFLAKKLKEEAQKEGCIFLRIDPNITRRQHKKDGTVVEDGWNHEYVTELLKEEGYTHLGYNYGYSGNWLSRYTYRLDLNQPFDQVLKGIKRCKIYNRKNQMRDLVVHEASLDELPVLIDCQKELSHQRGFQPKPLEYFQRFTQALKPFIHYYVVTVNYAKAYSNLQVEKQRFEQLLEKEKDPQKIRETNSSIAALEKEMAEMTQKGYTKDETVPIGAKLIVMQGANVYNVNMYTKKTMMNFRAAFALHRYALEDLYQKGAKTYDFEGISGSLDPKDEYYGQQDFKKSFGGDFLEFLGEFDAIFDQKKYESWKKSTSLMSRGRRKIRYIFNKR